MPGYEKTTSVNKAPATTKPIERAKPATFGRMALRRRVAEDDPAVAQSLGPEPS